MLRAILIVLISLIHISVWSQQPSGNPFNVKYRKPVTREVKESIPVQQLPDSINLQVHEDTIPKTDTFLIEKEDTSSVSGENPFDRKEKKVDSISKEAESPVLKPAPEPLKDLRKPAKGIQVFFLLLSILLLIFIVNVEQGYFKDMWRVIANENYSALQQRNQRSTMRQIINVLGYIVFMLQGSIFLFHGMKILGVESPIIYSIWTCLLLVAAIYITRHLVLRYVKWLFNRERQLMLFGFDITTFNTIVGIILIPINSLLLFGPSELYKTLIIIGIVVILGFYVLRQLRWLVASRNWIVNSLLLFFVYLCAVEILPLWAISVIFW